MIALPEPLYGTCTISTFARLLNNSSDRCGLVPMPGEPTVSVPGFALASAITSFTVFAGTEGCTAITSVTSDISDTGSKSFSES